MDFGNAVEGMGRDLATFGPFAIVVAVLVFGLPFASALLVRAGSRLAWVPLVTSVVVIALWFFHYAAGLANPGFAPVLLGLWALLMALATATMSLAQVITLRRLERRTRARADDPR